MEDHSADKKTNKRWQLILFALSLIAFIILFRLMGWGDKLTDLRAWIAGLGVWGPFVFVLLYIIAVIAALPGSAITIAAAALFGSVLGVILVSIGATIGAALAFLISRYLARDLILRRFSSNETFSKLDRMTQEHGAIVVAITRLVPLFPFDILNYGFGLTAISFRTYVFWSWLCMLPGTILYVVGTDAIISGISSGKVPWLLVSIIVLAGIVLGFLVYLAKKKLAQGEKKNINNND